MKIDEIENGIVFDHIAAGKGMEVYNTLRLDKLKCQVAIIQNRFAQMTDDIIRLPVQQHTCEKEQCADNKPR